ncbi:hypothetical protein Bbelb_395000 [Branchiostoma belcheri]|nr:hypothetical protein Bbelb_395000 [Branchiostoma belcheri]
MGRYHGNCFRAAPTSTRGPRPAMIQKEVTRLLTIKETTARSGVLKTSSPPAKVNFPLPRHASFPGALQEMASGTVTSSGVRPGASFKPGHHRWVMEQLFSYPGSGQNL